MDPLGLTLLARPREPGTRLPDLRVGRPHGVSPATVDRHARRCRSRMTTRKMSVDHWTDPAASVVFLMMKSIALTASATALLLTGGASASGGNPWNRRCASMPAEQPAPAPLQRAALRFFPWIAPAAKALQSRPVYLVALSSDTAISRDGDFRDASDYYLHRALVAVAPSYNGQVVITGHRIGASKHRATLGFSTDGANSCTVTPPDVNCGSRPLRFANALTVKPHPGWRIVQTELRIGRTGCFTIIASGRNLHARIPLSVPGPDYGTPGW